MISRIWPLRTTQRPGGILFGDHVGRRGPGDSQCRIVPVHTCLRVRRIELAHLMTLRDLAATPPPAMSVAQPSGTHKAFRSSASSNAATCRRHVHEPGRRSTVTSNTRPRGQPTSLASGAGAPSRWSPRSVPAYALKDGLA